MKARDRGHPEIRPPLGTADFTPACADQSRVTAGATSTVQTRVRATHARRSHAVCRGID